ncbi:MAG: hypothetical protein JWO44_1195 [Bacteroidetes bacterium]|nr:hypothetical protein [Bacteroidota bacterium]
METTKTNSKAVLWTSRIISILSILFLLMDAIMKIVKAAPSIEGCVQLGWPVDHIQSTGIILLICTILYSIPKTSILGAILVTSYLGGAVAIMVRANAGGHPYFFPIIFGVFIWIPLFLQNEKLRTLIPIRKAD